MSTVGYEIGATIPVQVGKGKMEKGEENTEKIIAAPKQRNEEYGYITIPTVRTVTKANDEPTKKDAGEGR